MSSYENYGRVSGDYDATRGVVGLEIILGCLATGCGRLDRLRVLDAGCGTGNYARAIAAHVGKVAAVDLNPEMLAVARGKLAAEIEAGNAELHRSSLRELPLETDSIDGVMVNQVLHHLGDDAHAGWPAKRSVVAELRRVLRPGGVAVINICSHRQLREGWWYLALIPRAVEAMCARHIPLDTLERLLSEEGFEPRARMVPTDALMQGTQYFDPSGPTRAEWRHGDSIWALVDEAEMAEATARWRALDEAARADFVARHDRPRATLGQFTFLHAQYRR